MKKLKQSEELEDEKYYKALPYRFKYYFKDGSTEISGSRAAKPEYLYNDFDGFLDWDEFYELCEKDLTTKDILKMAFEIYKDYKKEFYKIEIIEEPTGRVVDCLEEIEKI